MPKPYALVMLLATLGLPLTGLAATPTVRIDSGELIGTESDGVASFRGIPYAAPPVGALRWRAPQRPGAWKQPRSAADFGPSCLQAQPPRRLPAGSAAARLDEDCLTLNVWTPAAHAKPLPVMVFIHGGSNLQGSGASIYYDGSTFAHDGVILVTLNYRLGLLGFFAHASLTHASSSEPLANYGIMDQIAALEWVSRNIAAFGGDPHNVTVFGESAGALDALILMTAPRAAHLFHKAIVESAPIWGNWFSLAEAEKQGAEVATAMGLSGANASVNELRAVAASHVLAVDPSYVLGPVVDGKLLPRSPIEIFAHAQALDIPLIIGTNDNESSLLGAAPIANNPVTGLGPDVMQRLRVLYAEVAGNEDQVLRRAFRDARFAAPARWIASHSASGKPAYLYRFDYVLSLLRERRAGADHGSEIPFVFGTLEPRFMNDADRSVTAALHGCWVAFATSGTPACAGAPAWPAYGADSDQLMEFGDRAAAHAVPDANVLDILAARLLH